MAVHRCQHLKTTGQQCGSPAMRAQTFCYFHHRWKAQYAVINEAHTEHTPGGLILPVLEDYESIQMAIMQVLQTLTTGHLDTKTAGLLSTASRSPPPTSATPNSNPAPNPSSST